MRKVRYLKKTHWTFTSESQKIRNKKKEGGGSSFSSRNWTGAQREQAISQRKTPVSSYPSIPASVPKKERKRRAPLCSSSRKWEKRQTEGAYFLPAFSTVQARASAHKANFLSFPWRALRLSSPQVKLLFLVLPASSTIHGKQEWEIMSLKM